MDRKIALVLVGKDLKDDGTPYQSVLTKTEEEQKSDGVVIVTPTEMKNKRVLGYISSYFYKNMTIEFREGKIDKNIIHLIKLADSLSINDDGQQSKEQLEVLSEMFPDKAGKLRRAHMLNKSIFEVL